MPQYYPASQVLATISRMGHIMDDQGLFTAADRKLIWTKTSLAAALKDGLTVRPLYSCLFFSSSLTLFGLGVEHER